MSDASYWVAANNRALRLLAGLILCSYAISLGGCDDDGDIVSPDVFEGVTTFKDATFNFGALRTFAMPDTVVHVQSLTGTPIQLSRQFDHVALETVRSNLVARGYMQVTPSETTKPDFVVLVSATASEKYAAFVDYPWYASWGFYDWSWYMPGFTSGWGIVYPWAPQVTAVLYDRGTMVVDLIPTVTVNPLDQTITSKWAGVASAVMDESIVSGTVGAAVDQMFALSPYLRPAAAPGPLR